MQLSVEQFIFHKRNVAPRISPRKLIEYPLPMFLGITFGYLIANHDEVYNKAVSLFYEILRLPHYLSF